MLSRRYRLAVPAASAYNRGNKGGGMGDEPRMAQKGPYAVGVEAGKTYWWCACGRSAKQPLCDGSHRITTLTPVAFTAEKNETVHLCGCKRTKTPPRCDGTHRSL
jgi:CDGSH-type Zn-finger protein